MDTRISYYAFVYDTAKPDRHTGSGGGMAYSATVSECLAKLREAYMHDWYQCIQIRGYDDNEILYTYYRNDSGQFDFKDYRDGHAA